MRRFSIGLMSLALCLVMPTGAAANLVTNGGFETGDFTGWVQSGDTSFTGVSDDNPHSGEFAAFFGPIGDLGFITQTLSTTPGDSYDLTFWLAADFGTPNQWQVSWNGVVISDNVNVDPFGYTQFGGVGGVQELTFTGLVATGASTELQFGLRHDPAFFDLDDVSVEATIPEPGTLALLGTGLAALGFARRRRK